VLGRNYSNDSIVSVDMDVVGVMAAYLPMVRVCTALSKEALSIIRERGTVHHQGALYGAWLKLQ